MKKTLKYTGIIFLSLFFLLLLAPFLFKNQIVGKIKSLANEQLTATLDFDNDISLSFIRNFPNASLGIKNLSVVGREEFPGDTLAASEELRVVVDLKSLFGEEYQIRDVFLRKPYVQLLVDSSGAVNWDIVKTDSSAESTEEGGFRAALQKYSIQEGKVIYSDASMGFQMIVDGLDHTGKGDFTQDIFDLKTHSHARALTLSYGGISWISGLETDLDADINIDMLQYKYSFSNSEARFNGLVLGVDGFVAMPDSDIDIQMDFAARDADFKNILSLIPAIYQKDFESLKASGKVDLSGQVKGVYNEERMPGFFVDLAVSEGMFQYPSVPEALSDVRLQVAVRNDSGDMDHTEIDVDQLHFRMGNNPFDAHLTVRNPISDPLIGGAVKGRLNLSDVEKIYPLEEGTSLQGVLDMDVEIGGRLSDIEHQRFDQFRAKGYAKAQNLLYETTAIDQVVDVASGELHFSPEIVRLTDLDMKIGKSDLQADGGLDNLFGYLFGKDKLKGRLNVRSGLLDLNEWMSTVEVENVPEMSEMSDSEGGVEAIVIPRNIAFRLQTDIGRFLYDNLDLKNIRGEIDVDDGILSIRQARADLLDGSTQLSGSYNTQNPEAPKTDFAFQADKINIRQAFETFNTVQLLAPIAAFVEGEFSGDISLSSLLNKNLFPQLTTINSLGNIDIPNLEVKGFEPLIELASSLGISALREMDLRQLFVHFEVNDGFMHVRPFDFAIDGIQMTVAGKNGLNKDIDYDLDLAIPRSKLGNVDNALTKLVSQANQLAGSDVKLNEMVHAKVHLGGTITKPQIRLDLSEERARIEKAVKEEAKGQLKGEADRLLNQLFSKEVVSDSLHTEDSTLQEKSRKEEAKEDVKDAVKKGLRGLLNRKKEE